MSVVDSVFLAVPDGPQEVGDWLVGDAGAEIMAIEGQVVRLRMRGATGDDWFGVVVQPNGYVAPDPEPDEVQAMDGYAIEIQLRGGASYDALHREAGRLFDTVIGARPGVPALLVHNLDTLVSAHLPGAGTHTFEPEITPDVEDIDSWRGWIHH